MPEMNWKSYFEKFKIGDKVEFVQISKLCPYSGDACCRNLIGKTGEITHIWKDVCKRPYNVKFPNRGGNTGCSFEKECLRKV